MADFVTDRLPESRACVIEQGQPVVLTPFGGTAKTITAIFDLLDLDRSGVLELRRALVQVYPGSDGTVGLGVSDYPSRNVKDRFTVAGTTYEVEKFGPREFLIEVYVKQVKGQQAGGDATGATS